MSDFDGDLVQWVPTMGNMIYLQISICSSTFHPALSLPLGAISVVCVCLTARLCFTSQLLCLHTQLVFAFTQVPAGAKGQAQSTAIKSKGNAAPFKSDYYVSYLNLLPGICKWEVTKMYCNPFISYNFYIAWLLSDEITLEWMKRQMLTEPSLALLLDHLQEVRVAWLWRHPFRLSPCLPALSCHVECLLVSNPNPSAKACNQVHA